MSRREFLQVISGGAIGGVLGACSASPGPSSVAGAPRRPIRAVCFDLFTLFDPRSVNDVAATIAGDGSAAFCETWRNKQFVYAFLRASAGQYADFEKVTFDSLAFAERTHGLSLTAAQRKELVAAYSRLVPWPDAASTLQRFKDARLKLAPLANYAPGMLSSLLENARLEALFDVLISTDAARTFKPDPRAYALGPSVLGLPREEIAFAAFGGWDAAGAAWFGFPTFWVNRLGVRAEELGPGPDATGATLVELVAWIERWA
jgi:2-haloacid dehalogenase